MKFFIFLVSMIWFLHAEPITPIPKNIEVNAQKVSLGKLLFFDTILSVDNTISCASCHDLQNGGDDGLRFSFGVGGKEGDINSPTVFNAIFNFRQFWNGRAKNLHRQIDGPISNPVEMANSFKNIVTTLKRTPYKSKFENIYSDGITKENIIDAIVEYEKTLITPNSPFDNYLNGDISAISKEQKAGYKLFKDKGCIACHHGVNVGGNLYNKFGVMQNVDSKRLGRYEVTKNEIDKYYFKVPSLRNIEKTAPYLHDGRYETLDEVVKFMSKYQLGQVITQEEVDKIVEFLKTLSGEIPASAKR